MCSTTQFPCGVAQEMSILPLLVCVIALENQRREREEQERLERETAEKELKDAQTSATRTGSSGRRGGD